MSDTSGATFVIVLFFKKKKKRGAAIEAVCGLYAKPKIFIISYCFEYLHQVDEILREA